MRKTLQKLEQSTLEALQKATTLKELQSVYTDYFGKKGLLKEILSNLKNLSPDEKQTIGKAANELKNQLEGQFKNRQNELNQENISKSLKQEWLDLTAPGKTYEIGHIHPLSQTQEEVERIFQQMGFSIIDGPEIESEYYNFEGLNIPAHHPARDMQDTFFLDKKAHHEEGRLVLRTHTSPNQIRAMRKYGVPLRIIVPGRVFRNEATDASHEHTFDQVEGLLIDRDISLAHLKGVMTDFLSRLFKKEMKIRFRPGYFPFVEPGLELDMSCVFCNEKGCRVCKKTGWIEFMGCGMTHPHVIRSGGADPTQYQGWAFGFGLTRLVMMRYGIDDIRHLTSGDVRFLEQF
ncbi:MAG: phenylalanyl-tRNA synthetase subunit alpha, phenylalanyl-tRNA synthetase alpha chain [Candidatus Peregrinibacteria bacterium GW2011_GWF2_39_17]|nr:MAG: phenylalanyl-tRNA synthetase subunit alpha, phenylalanyl-tRNA synthetase alpha chain [Candidatus Peregrinibacteria bacterium GW2011_GWF2_39_17]HCW32224.1 phenylalanine--tRNA ligase subunit alpha [Candidatus Peregrinibacteria bacterium]